MMVGVAGSFSGFWQRCEAPSSSRGSLAGGTSPGRRAVGGAAEQPLAQGVLVDAQGPQNRAGGAQQQFEVARRVQGGESGRRLAIPGVHAGRPARVQEADMLPGAGGFTGGFELGGGARHGRWHAVFLQRAAELLGHEQLLERSLARPQPAYLSIQQGQRLGQLVRQALHIRRLGQDLEDLHLGAGDEGRRILAARFDAAHLDTAVLEDAEVAVGDRRRASTREGRKATQR